MPKEFSRTRRVSELIRRELANIIATRLGDPRLNMVTITAVDVSKDLKYANVFITQLNNGDAVLKTLNKASGFLRKELSSRVNMKVSPSLRFSYDHSVERGMALSRLIEEVNQPPRDEEA
ncbi:MAG: 30S ribosome-binding factor RbfA [Arenicellales bacterium]|nr:30S ribosome-binding factor RbfA [Arenicellales bacterium]